MCSKDFSKNVDEQFEELKQQYFNSDGTSHTEVIKINNSELAIRTWLDMLRYDKIENFIINAVTIVNETHFEWYLSFDSIDGIMEENSFNLVVKFKDALDFCKKRKELIRQNQWSDLKVEVLY